MRVLICGSRTFTQTVPVIDAVHKLAVKHRGDVTIISGGAKGADATAERAGLHFDLEVEVYMADWSKFGKRAGYLRNQRMLDEGKPDLVLAFRSTGESRGTDMMVDLARKAGVPTFVYNASV